MSEQGGRFFECIQGVDRLLVLDLGFLGDSIHLIPSLHVIRDALPEARIDVMIASHVTVILDVVPGLNRVLGYPRFPKGPKWYEDFGRVSKLRQTRYDAVINLSGSDRSSILTRASGARWRLGRTPPKTPAFWRHCFTHVVSAPFYQCPVFEQRLDCMTQAGFPRRRGEAFQVEVPSEPAKSASEKVDGETDFIHFSPCTTEDKKELPMPELTALLNQLIAEPNGPKVVVSCAPNERERGKLGTLLEGLERPPWKVFAGDLSLLELAAVIGRARIHFGGDSGALHLALMMNTGTVSWFRDYEGMYEWLPTGPAHQTVIGQESPAGLVGVTAGQLFDAWKALA